MKTIRENGKDVQVVEGELDILEPGKGIVFTTPDGTKHYELTIDNAGSPVWTLVEL